MDAALSELALMLVGLLSIAVVVPSWYFHLEERKAQSDLATLTSSVVKIADLITTTYEEGIGSEQMAMLSLPRVEDVTRNGTSLVFITDLGYRDLGVLYNSSIAKVVSVNISGRTALTLLTDVNLSVRGLITDRTYLVVRRNPYGVELVFNG